MAGRQRPSRHGRASSPATWSGPQPGTDWHVQGAGQFNGDGRSDILWQNDDSGQAAVWLMEGTTLLSGVGVGPSPGADWDIIA